jgi:O-antigen/teichoic acid export membrane protein
MPYRGLYLARCAGAIASLGYGLLLADVLAPDAMGELAVAVSVALIAATISKCGLDAYLMRRVAQSPHSARNIAARCLAAAGIAGAIAWAVCVWAGFGIRPGIALTFSVFQLATPFLAMSFVLTGLLKAGNFPATATFLETGCWQSTLCVCAIFMGYAGSDSLLAAAICFAAGSALAFAVFLPPAFRLVFAQEPSRRRLPAWLSPMCSSAGRTPCGSLSGWIHGLWRFIQSAPGLPEASCSWARPSTR